MSAYLKWTAAGRKPARQGGPSIPMGEWTATVEYPALCRSGWHACRWEDTLNHVAAELWVCDLDGLIVEGADKVVASRLRLVEQVPVSDRVFRLWAADCAEQALPIFEAEHPGDDRPRKAIEAARLFAIGMITRKELDAAWAAAWAAARAAARDAARAAARAWQVDRLLEHYLGLNPALFAHRQVTR